MFKEDVSFALSVIASVHLSHEVGEYFTFIMMWIVDPLGCFSFLFVESIGMGEC